MTDKEAIRKEIRKMRHTRDSLVQQRQELDERQHRVDSLAIFFCILFVYLLFYFIVVGT